MRRVVVAAATGSLRAFAALLMSGLCSLAIAEGTNSFQPPALLTNLFQLRECAEQEQAVIHPFRIIADVYDADSAAGVLALHDASGTELIHVDFQGQEIEPGETVCLEGKGCSPKPESFGLTFVPGMLVDNDGIHSSAVKSGMTFLHAGLNPIRVQCFNGTGDFSLNVEYEGPNLRRQRIPSSVLSRSEFDPATGATNIYSGLDYRCYEGAWQSLPDFARLQPTKTGVATNFDLNLRTRNENVGLDFTGFINVPSDGVYTFRERSDDGSKLFVGESVVDIRVLNGQASPASDIIPASASEKNGHTWVTLLGTVNYAGVWKTGGELQMRVGNDDILVEVLENAGVVPNFPPGAEVKASGICEDVTTGNGSRVPGRLLVSSWKAVRPTPTPEDGSTNTINLEPMSHRFALDTVFATNAPSTIATVAQIKALSREAADKAVPVSVRGVVTAVIPSGFVVQDATKGIYVWQIDRPATIQRGAFCQVNGVTGSGPFGPMVIPRRITYLGIGRLPEPLHATWDRLINGSLDTQYAEIDGVVTATHNQQITMLTEYGKVTLLLNDIQPAALASYDNALVQIRGCVFGPFNSETHRIDPGSLRIDCAVVNILQPAPADVFDDAPQEKISELLLYDPKASPFRMLKVRGQVMYGQAREYYLADGTNGLRVTIRNADHFDVGDLVEAAGFLELGGPIARLNEAVMRKTGSAALPAPVKLTPDHLLVASYAGTLVTVDGLLMNRWLEGSEQVLELQSGFLAFRARVNSGGQSFSLPPSGSRLELTGVYAPQGKGSSDGEVNGFDLLLNSPSGLRILATPPWWTLKRVFVLSTILAGLLCAVLLWNKQLHRQVQARGRRLEIEICNRQEAELKHAAEAERSRIARDLHDELGMGLTAVSLLASTGLDEFHDVGQSNGRFRIIADKARALVSGLDVIVWAIDPKHNSLESFADYLESSTKELLSASGIVCRFQIPIECGAITLTGPVRHSLFLAVKETLNNAVRHASATEMHLTMSLANNQIEIVIADNGCGFDRGAIRPGHGLVNLEERLKMLNGQCRIESKPGKGTKVKFIVPLPRDSD